MRQSDAAVFARAFGVLAATYSREVTPDQMEGYWNALEDLPIEAVTEAMKKASRASRFFPAAAELRELSGVPTPVQLADAAWVELLAAIRSVGAYGSPNLPDLTRATVRSLGGWRYLCSQDADELATWTRKAFGVAYEGHVASPPKDVPRIVGMHGTDGAMRLGPATAGELVERVMGKVGA